MPCYVDPPSHLENAERALNQLLDEIGDTTPRRWGGNIWGQMRDLTLDACAQRLCDFCKTHDVRNYSLELQIWWRDHQVADAEHEADAREAAERRRVASEALAKLTPAERKALGLDKRR